MPIFAGKLGYAACRVDGTIKARIAQLDLPYSVKCQALDVSLLSKD